MKGFASAFTTLSIQVFFFFAVFVFLAVYVMLLISSPVTNETNVSAAIYLPLEAFVK